VDEDEEKQLRTAALKNAQSILIARQNAERALLEANAELERKSEELQQQREWFEVTLSSIGDAVITTDIHGRVTFMNPVAESMTGWSSGDATGKSIDDVFHIINEDTRLVVSNPVNKTLQSGAIVGLANHTALVARNGTVISIEDSAAPIRNTKGEIVGAVLVFHDVTQRRLAEQALRDSDRRKDEFLATLAHELRNPLAPIRQAALISKSPTATDAQKRWSHDVISRQVHHMALLLDDLLDISRITRGTLELRTEMTDLAAVIDAAVEMARPALDAKRHAFSTEIPDEPLHFAADPLRVSQVLANLLTNAAKYSDPGGRVVLRAEAHEDTVIFRVSDSGIGITAHGLQKIFDMFSQVKSGQDRSEGGLGIGLSLSKALVELHGGTIEAKSSGLGCGSEFIVRLPLRAFGKARYIHSAGSTSKLRIGRRVLIADDNRDAAESLAMLLELDGHVVTVAHDGHEALAAFHSTRPEFALIDIGMPKLDGYEVAREVRRGSLGGAVTLIALTGWGQEGDKAQALAAGFDHHFTKPIEPAQVSALLRGDEPSIY
jgi:PAS domain S-box-containing protein